MAGTVNLLTYADLVEQLIDYHGVDAKPSHLRDARRAVAAAYRDFPNEHNWTYYYQHGRITTDAPYKTGTIEYDQTGGGFERMVTLTDGIWPTWAAYGVLIVNNIIYQVAERKTDSQITLSIQSNIGADLAAGTSYTLARDTYPMPFDFISTDEMHTTESWRTIQYTHPRNWLAAHRHNSAAESSTPAFFTITGDPNFFGCLAARFYPFPDSSATIDFVYKRMPRALKVEKFQDGTVSSALGIYTLSGVGMTFVGDHVGTVVRLSGDAKNYPTARTGINPFKQERILMSVVTDQVIAVDAVWDQTLAGVKYTLSDPIDLEPGVMTTAFIRLCEKEFGLMTRLKDRTGLIQAYELALERARSADSRYTGPRVSGGILWERRLANMPRGADVG
jgi:hypothetical protein